MIATQQNDLFGFAEVVAKPMRLSWKKCACADCTLGECYCEFRRHEIMLTENSGVFEVLIIDFSKNDGFGEMVTEKPFKSIGAAKDFAEAWAAAKAT